LRSYLEEKVAAPVYKTENTSIVKLFLKHPVQSSPILDMFELYFSEETDLKCPLDKDAWLVRFLRPCKFYPESALQLVSHPFCI
jgi:hypothetical protein